MVGIENKAVSIHHCHNALTLQEVN